MWKWHRHPSYVSYYYFGETFGHGRVYKAGKRWVGENERTGERMGFRSAALAKEWVAKSLKVKPERNTARDKIQVFKLPAKLKKQFPLIKGISIGRCVSTGRKRSKGKTRAHAHIGSQDVHYGWICFFKVEPLERGVPTTTFLHEYAHLMRPKAGHGPMWKETFRGLLFQWGYKNKVRNRFGIKNPVRR